MKNFYILVGPPGSGKGTQAQKISKKYNLTILSPGALLRDQIKSRTKIGKLAEPFVLAGELVPNEIFLPKLLQILKQSRKSLLLDGFPRTIEQYKILSDFEKENEKCKLFVFEIDVSTRKLQERVGGRWHCHCGEIFHTKYRPSKRAGICDICQQKLFRRSDEKPDILRNRLLIYRKKTSRIIRLFEGEHSDGYFLVNGDKNIDDVNKQFAKIFKKIHGLDKR
ncbi:MAG: nucleoside monophosphate kinase [Patescibacteria group bacterium]